MNENKKLHEIILQQYGHVGLKNKEIPYYINGNLSRELREYQSEAIKYFLLQRQMPNAGNHLMFNMATGSGKTLVMAALILECYAKGYRDFIFFVNSTAILEKTKENFYKASSSKYLFKQDININSAFVDIRGVDNLEQSQEGSINIHFTTIQSIFSTLKSERENALCINDFKNRKIVFLADEAHHLNADTKKASRNANTERWETIIKKAYESHEENLILEFSATIPQDTNTINKYRSKIIYEYDLSRFCNDGYSKRIFIMKYGNAELSYRFLGGILLSLFRELIGQKYGIVLKPVLLFKSEAIQVSRNNEALFIDFIRNLNTDLISRFYKNLHWSKDSLFARSLDFFKERFGDSYLDSILQHLRNNFNEKYMLNTNDDKELIKNQEKLNSLEDKDNLIRIIFSVDKLNEGWDVLNLFDIIRLGNKSSSTTSTKEAQLIGRGARYYPFTSDMLDVDRDLLYKRKYDNSLDSELSMLERLSYHTLNEVDFIKNLNKSMHEQGLLVEDRKKFTVLKPNKTTINPQKQDSHSFSTTRERMKNSIQGLKIPLLSFDITEEDTCKDQEKYIIRMHSKKPTDIDTRYFLKAMNMLGLGFAEIKRLFDFSSKREFIDEYIKDITFLFDKKQQFNKDNNLEIAKFIIENIKMYKDNVNQALHHTPSAKCKR